MILVTGASGTNGSELITLLSERGVSVRGMVRRPRTHSDTAVFKILAMLRSDLSILRLQGQTPSSVSTRPASTS